MAKDDGSDVFERSRFRMLYCGESRNPQTRPDWPPSHVAHGFGTLGLNMPIRTGNHREPYRKSTWPVSSGRFSDLGHLPPVQARSERTRKKPSYGRLEAGIGPWQKQKPSALGLANIAQLLHVKPAKFESVGLKPVHFDLASCIQPRLGDRDNVHVGLQLLLAHRLQCSKIDASVQRSKVIVQERAGRQGAGGRNGVGNFRDFIAILGKSTQTQLV